MRVDPQNERIAMGLLDSRWDDRCPHCETKVEMHPYFEAADYATTFKFECPCCKRLINVTVHAVPEFELEPCDG